MIFSAFASELFGQTKDDRPSLNITRTRLKAAEALDYCRSYGLNTSICILVDMSLHSGVNRMVVWDFSKDTILHSCLVSHGCCTTGGIWQQDQTKTNPRFSNKEGSHCSSLGKYKIGKRGHSSWGVRIKYLLYGLEASNINALAREIYFHSWSNVPDQEVYPSGTPEGWGCPAVSPRNLTKIDGILRWRITPVLLWIYV